MRGGAWFEVLDDEVLRPLGNEPYVPGAVGGVGSGWAVHPYADVLMSERVVETGWMRRRVSCGRR